MSSLHLAHDKIIQDDQSTQETKVSPHNASLQLIQGMKKPAKSQPFFSDTVHQTMHALEHTLTCSISPFKLIDLNDKLQVPGWAFHWEKKSHLSSCYGQHCICALSS